MKHRFFLTLGIGSGVFIWLSGLATGYFVDPALPVLGYLAPPDLPLGGLPLAFLVLPLALLAKSVAIVYCVRLVFVRKTRRNVGLALAALIGPLVFLAGPRLVNSFDAFVYRMESFSEAEYQQLASDVKTAFEERGISETSFDADREKRRAIVESLVESHPILAISEFRLDVGASDERVSLRWASGLTGGYLVSISLRPDPPSEWAGPAGPGPPGPYQILEITYIYEGVALKHLP